MINYYLLTKPGIILGNLVPFAAGFLLSSKGAFHFWLFLSALVGLALIMASACVFNNFIDRHVDKKMERTKNRALVTGIITPFRALLFATMLALFGNYILWNYTNLSCVLMANFGFFIYVVLYSLWKCHTVYGTAIGSVAGAVPPVVGYLSANPQWDLGALILFSMMVLWQMPHFFAIAIYRFEDYAAAGIPALPITKGIFRAKVHMALYIAAFIFTSVLLTHFNYTGRVYMTVVLALGSFWLILSVKGFKEENERLWGRRMFALSLLVILSVCMAIPFDII
jgi:heme o synthase